MIILATDTSTATGSVALCDDAGIRCEAIVRYGRAHSERLLATTDWVLHEAGLTLADVDMLAVSHGPGSFTGLRIGVAAWKGLAVGADKPLIGVDTLSALAHQALPWHGTICSLLDARMKEVFGAVFSASGMDLAESRGPSVGPVETVLHGITGPVLITGDGAAVYRERILAIADLEPVVVATAVPCASTIATLARMRLAEGAEADADGVEPVYLRKSQAEEAQDKANV